MRTEYKASHFSHVTQFIIVTIILRKSVYHSLLYMYASSWCGWALRYHYEKWILVAIATLWNTQWNQKRSRWRKKKKRKNKKKYSIYCFRNRNTSNIEAQWLYWVPFSIRMNLLILLEEENKKNPIQSVITFTNYSLCSFFFFPYVYIERTLRMAFLGLSTKNLWKMIGRQVNKFEQQTHKKKRKMKWKISWIYFSCSIVLSHAFYYSGIE